MDKKKLESLREIAERASPGPWHIGHVSERGGIHEDADIDDCEGCNLGTISWRRDQAFIASFSPDVALALIADNLKMREALEAVLIKVDWNSDEFSDIKQYTETRQIILKALEGADNE